MIDANRLYSAAVALYHAGRWSCDRPVNEEALWTALRDALGLPAGTSPPPKLGLSLPELTKRANEMMSGWKVKQSALKDISLEELLKQPPGRLEWMDPASMVARQIVDSLETFTPGMHLSGSRAKLMASLSDDEREFAERAAPVCDDPLCEMCAPAEVAMNLAKGALDGLCGERECPLCYPPK